jgi:hypothetical protein
MRRRRQQLTATSGGNKQNQQEGTEMSKRIILSAGLMLAAGLAAAASQPAVAALGALSPKADTSPPAALLQLADARRHYHCHNMPRRTRCHAGQRLPVNWPPNTNTPRRSRLSERHADRAGACANGRRGWFCLR